MNPPLRALVSPDLVWRAERHPDGWHLYRHLRIRVRCASWAWVEEFLRELGVNPDLMIDADAMPDQLRVMRILRTPDRRQRAEQRPDGWWVYLDGALVAQRVSLDRVVAVMLERGGRPEDLVED